MNPFNWPEPPRYRDSLDWVVGALIAGMALIAMGLVMILASPVWAEDYLMKENPLSIASMPHPTGIILNGPNGKTATIDFNGDSVKYSGDLPVDESAKVFFDAVMSQMKCGDK